MNWPTIQRNWTALVPRMTQRWPDADEAVLLSADGNRDALADHLVQALNVDKALAEEEIDAFAAGAVPADAAMNPTNDNANIAKSDQMIPPGEGPLDDDSRFGDEGAADQPLGRTG